MMATAPSRSTMITLGSTVALTMAASVMWQRQLREKQTAVTNEAVEQEQELEHVPVTDEQEEGEMPKEAFTVQEPQPPTKVVYVEEEDDNLSSTDKSSSGSSEGKEAGAVTVTPEEEQQAEDNDDQEEEEEEEASRRPSSDAVQALGWDSDEVPVSVRIVEEPQGIQYTGAVGAGTGRCVRAIDPLPKPSSFQVVTQTHIPSKTKNKTGLLRKNKSKGPTTTTKVVAEPFVQSFALVDGTKYTEPGMVSYFEVDIVQAPKEDQQGEITTEQEEAEIDDPCVAIGMSLHQFDWERSMPGWDIYSYGYHGDDGTAWLAKHKHQLGHAFGAGDTVGCGIDYTKRRVFYTRNGEFVGYSYELNAAQLKREWIPTVGLDSNAVVQYNGQGPFHFDLAAMQKGDISTDSGSVSDMTTASTRAEA